MKPALYIVLSLVVATAAFAETQTDPDRTYESGEVVVTASRYDDGTLMNVTNITQEELQLREPDLELPMLLQGIPGVFSYSDAGSGLGYTYLKIRGFDQRRVGVLFNGIPLNDPEDHQVWWVDMPDLAASVQDIQVQRGVTNSIGGMTAIGGTVNIVSADLAEKPGGMFSLNAGSYGFSRQMISYQTGKLGQGFSSMIRLSRQESDGYRDRSGHEGWGVFWSGQYETASTWTRINIYTGKELTHHAWDAVPESVLETNRKANQETYHNAVDNFRQPHYELHNTIYLNDSLSLTNRLYYIQGEGYYENYKDDQTAENYALDFISGVAPDDELDLIRQKWVRKDHVGWVPGLEWNQDRGRLLVGGDLYTFHSNHWGDVLWAEGFTPADFNQQFKYHEYTGDKDAYSLYANQRYRIVGGLTATVDLHFQHKEYSFMQNEVGNFVGNQRNAYTVDYDFFNPKAALHWQMPGRVVGGSMAVYGSVGRNHREPTDGELFNIWDSGSDFDVDPLFDTSREVLKADGSVDYLEWSGPQVQEERVDDYEIGFSWQNPHLSFTLGGYWMDFKNEIVPYGGTSEDGSSIRGNAGKTEHKGLELGLRARLTDRHDLAVAASRSWDRFKEFIYHGEVGPEEDYSGNPIALFPSRLLMVTWDAAWTGAVKSRTRLRNTGRQHLDNSGNREHTIDPWATVDLSLWFNLGKMGLPSLDGARGFVHVRNLGDTEYETWGYWSDWDQENFYTPAAGRNFAVGMDYNF
ncbi:MAG: TonB-dependent receptor [Candidatus Krumholzibacteriota bacterium]